MNLLKGSLQDELDNFFQSLHQHPVEVREVSKAAFSKARQHLKHTAFIELNDTLLSDAYQTTSTKTWQGHRLCAIDGSTLRLPNREAIAEHFGRQQDDAVPQARLSVRYDVLNQVTLDTELAPIATGERELAYLHLEKSQIGDLYLYDRGYTGFVMWAMHRAYQRDYVTRLPLDFCQEVTDFLKSSSVDSIVNLSPNKDAKSACMARGISHDALRVRLIKVVLTTGEIEVLATSLMDASRYCHDQFQALYFLRWGVEEDIKVKKHRLEIENFSGLSVESIYQDVHAKVLTQNMTRLVAWIAEPIIEETTKHRKRDYQLNFTQALSKMKHTVVSLITACHPDRLLKALVALFAKTVEPIRPDRSFERKKSREKRKFHRCYKSTR